LKISAPIVPPLPTVTLLALGGMNSRIYRVFRSQGDQTIMAKSSQAAPSAEQATGLHSLPTRRKEPRTSVSIPLKLYRDSKGEKSSVDICTENLSRFGACLVTPVELEIGEVVRLECVSGECELQGTVRYLRQGENGWRAGVEFVAFPKKWLIMQLAVSAMLDGKWIKPRRSAVRK
jgi:hypothetical protein